MGSYPDNLLYYVKKLQGYSRNNVKILPLTSTSAKFGGTITFRLPTNSLIDLSTWAIHGDLNMQGTDLDAQVHFARDTASMIRTMQIQIGGQTIQNLDHYNTVWQALKQSTQSSSSSACNKLLEFDSDYHPAQARGLSRAPATAALTAETSGVLATELTAQSTFPGTAAGAAARASMERFQVGEGTPQSEVPFIIRNWLGFLACSPSILDTSLTGEIVITITLEQDPAKFAQGVSKDYSLLPGRVPKALTAAETPANCQLDTSVSGVVNLFSTCDVINIADGVYDMVARQALESGMLIEIPVPNYYTFGDNASSFNFTSRFTIGCQSLDAAMVLCQRPDFTGNSNDGIDETQSVIMRAAGDHHTSTVEEYTTKDRGSHLGCPFYMIQKGLRFDGTPCAVTKGDGWQFEVNGAFVPAHRVNLYDTYYYQKLAFGIHGADHGNLLMTQSMAIREGQSSSPVVFSNIHLNDTHVGHSKTGFPYENQVHDRNWIPVVRFSHSSADKRMLSGIDARSNPVQLAFNCRANSAHANGKYVDVEGAQETLADGGTAQAAALANTKDVKVTVVALCTSTLMIGAGQQLSFSA